MEYISFEDYATNVNARCSKEFHCMLVHPEGAAAVIGAAIETAKLVDDMKKALFYGKIDGTKVEESISFPCRPTDQILHAMLGIYSEAGELFEAYAAASSVSVERGGNFSHEDFDFVNLREELGDVLWYVQLLLSIIDSNIPECITINDNKLERRYGKAFSADSAINRDLDAERKELEQ